MSSEPVSELINELVNELTAGSTTAPTQAFDKEIDTKGLKCPLPILRAKKALAEMQAGELLKVLATDPAAPRDFAAFAMQTKHELLESTVLEEGVFVLVLRRRL